MKRRITVSAIKEVLLPSDDEQISEGEEIIRDFLEDEGIAFDREVKITGLEGDTKAYRCADFYLKRLRIYVEFFGQWNQSIEHRNRYKEKKNVYYKNNIACVYLYPENLGTLDHTFDRRLREVLQRRAMKKELFRLNLWSWWKDNKVEILALIFFSWLISLAGTPIEYLVAGAAAVYMLFSLIRRWHMLSRPVPLRKPGPFK